MRFIYFLPIAHYNAIHLVTLFETNIFRPVVVKAGPILVIIASFSIIAGNLKTSGIFDSLAAVIANRLQTTRAVLFSVFILTALITWVLGNDAAVMLMTPLAITLMDNLSCADSYRKVIIGCVALTADFASPLIPTSNPLNLIVLSYFSLPTWKYIALTALPTTVILTVLWIFLSLKVKNQRLIKFEDASPSTVSYWQVFLIISIVVLIALGLAQLLPLPLAILLGACLSFLPQACRSISLRILVSMVPLRLLFLVVVLWFAATISIKLFPISIAHSNEVHVLMAQPISAALLTMIFTGIISGILNNLPAAVMIGTILSLLHEPSNLAPLYVAAAVIGGDAASRWSPYGSLAAQLWLTLASRLSPKIKWDRLIYPKTTLQVVATSVALALPSVLLGGLLFAAIK